MTLRILVCGDRNWIDRAVIRRELKKYTADPLDITVIHGSARGADSLAAAEAFMLGFNIMVFPANWDRYGKSAGPIRNQQMLTDGKPDLILAFHKDIENSKGTKDMVTRAKNQGIECIIIIE